MNKHKSKFLHSLFGGNAEDEREKRFLQKMKDTDGLYCNQKRKDHDKLPGKTKPPSHLRSAGVLNSINATHTSNRQREV